MNQNQKLKYIFYLLQLMLMNIFLSIHSQSYDGQPDFTSPTSSTNLY